MMGMPSHKKTWADKLEEAAMPDAGEAWQAMEQLLDKEMPVLRKKNRRPWLLFSLLLLLIVVFYLFYWHSSTTTTTPVHSSAAGTGTAVSPAPAGTSANRPGTSANPAGSSSTGTPEKAAAPGRNPSAPAGTVSSSGTPGRPTATPSTPTARTPTVKAPTPADPRHRRPSFIRRPMAPESTARLASGRAVSGAVMPLRSLHRSEPRPIGNPDRSPGKITAPALHLAHTDPVSKTKRTDVPHKKDSLSGWRGWELGVGFNQSIATGGQQVWNNRAGGFNEPLKDYYPVPSVRYHFNQRLYLQAEARIHAPQYTRKGLEFFYALSDSGGVGSVIGPIAIKKLFYFQLPVSIHYSPIPNWTVGLGLEYSRLDNGITWSADSIGSRAEPIRDYPRLKVSSFEFRGLAALDYTVKKWTIGLSYDAALSRFIDYQLTHPGVAAPPVVKGRNNSLQLFLRYYFWNNRKGAKLPLPAK